MLEFRKKKEYQTVLCKKIVKIDLHLRYGDFENYDVENRIQKFLFYLKNSFS